jgi:uncharacterized protein (DUF1499 family)
MAMTKSNRRPPRTGSIGSPSVGGQVRTARRRRVRVGLAALLTLGIGVRIYASTVGQPGDVRPTQSALQPCGSRSNCAAEVISIPVTNEETGTAERDRARAERVLGSLREWVTRDGGTITNQTGNYLAAVYRSTVFGFPDDVEFLFSPTASQISIRSASRIGSGDLGVNKKRVLHIVRRWKYRA